ncbi:MAG: alpha/beta fold hydrolase [Pseudomonadota bacterium]
MPAFEGFQVLRYDTRGHGQSSTPKGPYNLSMLAGDTARLFDHLEIQHVHFFGVSMGGMIGQTLALEHSDRVTSLALINTTPEYSAEQKVMWRERAGIVLSEGIGAVQDALMERWFTDEAIASQQPGYLYMNDIVARFQPESFDAVTAAMCELDTTSRLNLISAPTLVVAAPDDPGVPPRLSETLAREIPKAELYWLTPARHLATLEHVETFNDLARKFLLASASS